MPAVQELHVLQDIHDEIYQSSLEESPYPVYVPLELPSNPEDYRHFKRVGIANRGVPAARILRACVEAGIPADGVYNEADSNTLFVRELRRLEQETNGMYRAIPLGNGDLQNTYNNVPLIIEKASENGWDAVHPGWGLWSEDKKAAEQIQGANLDLVFIGPTPEAMDQLGNKANALALADELGIKTLPRIAAPETWEELENRLKEYPEKTMWILKESLGGGGMGNRITRTRKELQDAYEEMKSRYGTARFYLEQFLPNPRHIEVQLLADQYGNAQATDIRDCSVQRTRQKRIELSPALNLSTEQSDYLKSSAIALAQKAKYTGPGTAEFLIDNEGNIYFLEFNTRLQVEHGVSEATTKIDYVQSGIGLAMGLRLAKNLPRRANIYAMNVRVLVTEGGHIDKMPIPRFPWLRFDLGVEEGDEIQEGIDGHVANMVITGKSPSQLASRARFAVDLIEDLWEMPRTTLLQIRQVMDAGRKVQRTLENGKMEEKFEPNLLVNGQITTAMAEAIISRAEDRIYKIYSTVAALRRSRNGSVQPPQQPQEPSFYPKEGEKGVESPLARANVICMRHAKDTAQELKLAMSYLDFMSANAGENSVVTEEGMEKVIANLEALGQETYGDIALIITSDLTRAMGTAQGIKKYIEDKTGNIVKIKPSVLLREAQLGHNITKEEYETLKAQNNGSLIGVMNLIRQRWIENTGKVTALHAYVQNRELLTVLDKELQTVPPGKKMLIISHVQSLAVLQDILMGGKKPSSLDFFDREELFLDHGGVFGLKYQIEKSGREGALPSELFTLLK